MEIGACFSSEDDALCALRDFSCRTSQNFVILSGQPRLLKSNKLFGRFKHSSLRLGCKHHGEPSVPRKPPTARPRQATFKTGCCAYVHFKLREGKFCVEHLPKPEDHNHVLDELSYHYYPALRRLTDDEMRVAASLADSDVMVYKICDRLNSDREEKRMPGRIIPKDLHNLFTRVKAEQKFDRTEEEFLQDFITEVNETYGQDVVTTLFEAPGTDAENEHKILSAVYVQTPEMHRTMQRHGETLFMDTTYRISTDNYCLYSILAEDEHGFGQPVAIALLRNETKATLSRFLGHFTKGNADALKRTRCIFVDKDFTQLDVLRILFSGVVILFCAFHCIKAWKTRLGQQSIGKKLKQTLLALFRRVLYAKTEAQFKYCQKILKKKCLAGLEAYYVKNWQACAKLWVMAYRMSLPTRGNNTTNRIERFYLMVKSAFRVGGRVSSKKYDMTECLKKLLDVLNRKKQIASYQEHLNRCKNLVLHDFPDALYAKQVGSSLTKVAAEIVSKQFGLFVQQDYSVEKRFGDEWLVWKSGGRRKGKYIVTAVDGHLGCTCYVSLSFGLPCRHVIAVRGSESESLFAISDVISKWHRKEGVPDTCDVVPETLHAAVRGVEDDDLEEAASTPGRGLKRKHSTLGDRYKRAKTLCDDFASTDSQFGQAEFQLYMLELLKLRDAVDGKAHDPNRQSGKFVIGRSPKPRGRPNNGRRYKTFNQHRKRGS